MASRAQGPRRSTVSSSKRRHATVWHPPLSGGGRCRARPPGRFSQALPHSPGEQCMIDAVAATETPRGDVDPPTRFGLEDRTYEVDGPIRALGKRFNVLVKAEARGELAALKRLDPDRPDKSAFF